jgi:acyl-coenzyme A synthetase/AMP-(fatty) acid ligase
MSVMGHAGARTDSHRWEFRARFRKHAFGWRSQPAVLRIKEAVSEIKRVARRDPALAAEGAVMFLKRLSPALENQLTAHPGIAEAAVIGVPDQRWDERPLASVVLKEAASVTPAELSAFLAQRVARLWLPERWTFIDKIPRTSVDKFDKRSLRARYAEGSLVVEEVASS